MATRIVVGANWGDEGKGRMVDYFAQDADVVARFQGGNNAGHTIKNRLGEFKLHLMPSGACYPDVTNILGLGMVIDLAALYEEWEVLTTQSVRPNFLVSERATLLLPTHRLEDIEEEKRLGVAAFGSTKKGIAYAYADRYAKKAVPIGLLKNPSHLKQRLTQWYDWKMPMLNGLYGKKNWPTLEQIYRELMSYRDWIVPHIVNVHQWQKESVAQNLVLEAQLGSLKDVAHGNMPFTTSSPVLSSYAEYGSGLIFNDTPTVTAVVKSYSSQVGSGPFPCALHDMTAFRLKTEEFGATTGRARDVGHFDAVASRYGVDIQKASEIALTKLDCLTGFTELKLCTAYQRDGETVSHYPMTDELQSVQPIYKTLPGWIEDIRHIQTFADLPKAAQAYVLEIETLLAKPVRYISVGPERSQIIKRF